MPACDELLDWTRTPNVPDEDQSITPKLLYTHKKIASRCKVPDCTENGSVFGVPDTVKKSAGLLRSWKNVLCIDCSLHGVKVCEYHFEDKLILRAKSGRLRLHPKAFPCRNLP